MANAAGTIGRGADDAVRAMADGLTFGLADKAAAGARTLTGDAPSYGNALAQERGRTDAVGSGLPGANTALRAAGGLLGGVGLLKGGLSLGGAAVDAGRGFIGKGVGFGVDGAIAGAADAAGHVDSGNTSDYVDAAKRGATVGGLLGAGLPAAGQVAGSAYRAVSPFFAQPIEGMNRTATGLLSGAMTPRAASTLDRLGPLDRAVIPPARRRVLARALLYSLKSLCSPTRRRLSRP